MRRLKKKTSLSVSFVGKAARRSRAEHQLAAKLPADPPKLGLPSLVKLASEACQHETQDLREQILVHPEIPFLIEIRNGNLGVQNGSVIVKMKGASETLLEEILRSLHSRSENRNGNAHDTTTCENHKWGHLQISENH